uniref:Uncharacterized protein n=1 Tax=Aegilops tauschii subsp. strangulata TaxID=200361 RepID=A0A452YWM9_AEGTS
MSFCCCCELCAYVFQTQQKKQAAADVLFNYSQFVMVCIGEGVRPTDLRLHLMKRISSLCTHNSFLGAHD